MKKSNIIIACLILCAATFGLMSWKSPAPTSEQYEYYQFSTIESVVSMGLGRSRLISTMPNGEMDEAKMENFFSGVGINFGNVRNNDQMIVEKINNLTSEGWELFNTTTGVYSDPKGKSGIFISRYLFRKAR